MLRTDGAGNYDRLLRFQPRLTGNLFFAPTGISSDGGGMPQRWNRRARPRIRTSIPSAQPAPVSDGSLGIGLAQGDIRNE